MRTALILAAMLVAVPAQAKPWNCVLWPKQCAEPVPVEAAPVPAPRPVEAPPEPQSTPAPAPASAAVPSLPPAARAREVTPKPLPRIIRPKYKPAPAKARRAAKAKQVDWCKHVPAIATEGQVIKGAAGYGLTVSVAQARACLKSKKD